MPQQELVGEKQLRSALFSGSCQSGMSALFLCLRRQRRAPLLVAVVVLFIGGKQVYGQTDPLLEQQWHLKARSQEPAGANVRAAWPTTKGTGVVIGIVDDGLQHTHPDLQPNYSAPLSFDFNFNDSDPSPNPSFDFHGTAVAGVTGARGENGLGVSGAAPFTSLAGLRLTAAPVTDAQEAAALGHQGNAIHISSSSWGPSDNGATLGRPGPLTQAAMATAISQGRDGKGRIFTWAAGNGLENQDNCNFDGYANSRFVIAIGALADTGQQAFYSEPCSALFVTAPSNGGSRGITTTDLVSSAGYNPGGDYTDIFGGTSAAAPLVGGVAALLLAQNSTLTWRDVQHILARSAVKINPVDPGWTTGIFAHNEKFGFGLVDAHAAVNLATTWTNVAVESSVPAVTHTINQPIPDNNATGLTDSIVIGSGFANFTVEHVEVEFTATHSWRGDLEVTLTSPSGVVSRLATLRFSDSGDNFSSWRFGSVRHWGESAAGTWTLKVADQASIDIGTWDNWTLRIFGTSPPQADLSITKTDGVSTEVPGTSVTYTITAANAGPSDVTGATVADTFPAALTGCTWTCVGAGGGVCAGSGSGNLNTSVNLPNGSSVTYTATCTINTAATGTLSNTATITTPGGVTDPNTANNSATDTDTLTPQANLSIIKTDGVSTVSPDTITVYTIVAANAGPSDVTGATVADTFPAALTGCTWTCVGAGGGACVASGSGNINAAVNLPSGGSVTYTAACTINTAATGTLSNTATITTPGGVTDPNTANNSATDTDTVTSCLRTLNPPNQTVGAGGGTGNIVNVTASCEWTAASMVPWVTITGGIPGNGNGAATYNVQANPGSNSRRGTLIIAGKTFIVSQSSPLPPPCTITIPTGTTVPASGGSFNFAITASTPSCPWSAQENVEWITLTPPTNGTGNGTVSYSVGVNNTGVLRAGRITVNGKRYTVTQTP